MACSLLCRGCLAVQHRLQVRMRWARAASSISRPGAPRSIRSSSASCSRTDSSARPGTKLKSRVAQHAQAVPPAVDQVEDVRVRAPLEQHRVEALVELGERCGSNWASVSVMASLIGRARATSSGVECGADSAVAAPSTIQALHRAHVLRLVDHARRARRRCARR